MSITILTIQPGSYRQLAEHGGDEGLRDESLLHSALARPPNYLAYADGDTVALAAKDTAGIVQNHPFLDGNKRTGSCSPSSPRFGIGDGVFRARL